MSLPLQKPITGLSGNKRRLMMAAQYLICASRWRSPDRLIRKRVRTEGWWDMPNLSKDSLAEQFAALLAERKQNWDPARFAQNARDRADLVARFDPQSVVQPGDRLDPFLLIDTQGGDISSQTLLADGPAVLLFFRFGECPACNIALPHYDRYLAPALADAGIPLLAVSPQLPDRLRRFQDRVGLGLRLASDPDNGLARRLGITFLPAQIPQGQPPAGWIGELTGTNSWELPQPAILVLEQDHRIRSLTVSPDWLDRPEAEDILRGLLPETGSDHPHALAEAPR